MAKRKSRLDAALAKIPKKEREAAVRAVRQDGWNSLLTGIGHTGRDKREGTVFDADVLTVAAAEKLYEGDDIAARMVESVPKHMLRQGWTVDIENDKDMSEAVMASVDELDLNTKLEEAMSYARALGGSALLLGTDDGAEAKEPLDIRRIKSFDWLTLFTPVELTVGAYLNAPKDRRHGEPELYKIMSTMDGTMRTDAAFIHHSRLIRFDGVKLSPRRMRQNNGWGNSVLLRPHRIIRDYQMGWHAVSILLTEFSQAILKIKGLAEFIGEDGDTTIANRAAAMDAARSIARCLILDSEEEFQRETVSMAGIPETLREMAVRLAAAVEMPVTLLMGISPAGLNATGESDIRQWYDNIKTHQEKILRPVLNRILTIIFNSMTGPTGGKEPANWTVNFAPLWQMSETQLADLRNKQAQTDVAYINADVLTPEEVATSRFGGDAYSIETKLDMETRTLRAKMLEAQEEPAANLEEEPDAEAIEATA